MNKNSFLLKELKLQTPSKCYFDSETDNEAVAFCNTRNALLEQAINRTLYVKFIDGDRKGSIARVQIDIKQHPYNERKAEIVQKRSYHYKDKVQFEIENSYFFGTAKWDGRKNSCKLDMPGRDFVFLPNYQGPTFYEMV